MCQLLAFNVDFHDVFITALFALLFAFKCIYYDEFWYVFRDYKKNLLVYFC